jgi:hypothetical protein
MKAVGSRFIGGGFLLDAGSLVDRDYFRSHNGGAVRIHNGSYDAATRLTLTKTLVKRQERQNDEKK